MAWLGSWAYRIEITVDNTNIDSDLTWYPIPIFINATAGIGTDDLTVIFDEVGANSKKIAITDDDGISELYGEIQFWDDSGEEAVVWVAGNGITTATTASTKSLYIYYDNNQDDNTDYINTTGVGNSVNVWDSNFMLVCHMQSTSFLDSTSYGNDGTNVGCAISTSGKMGSCADLEATDNYINFSNPAQYDLTTALTLQCWSKTEDENDHGRIISKAYNGTGTASSCYQLCQLGNINTTGTAEFRHAAHSTGAGPDYDISPSSPLINFGTWYFRASTWSNATGNAILYLDNSILDTTGSLTGAIRTSSQDMVVGATKYDATVAYYHDGLIDEVRISNSQRTTAWLKADYYSQSDGILSYGTVEEFSGETSKTITDTITFTDTLIGTLVRPKRWWNNTLAWDKDTDSQWRIT